MVASGVAQSDMNVCRIVGKIHLLVDSKFD